MDVNKKFFDLEFLRIISTFFVILIHTSGTILMNYKIISISDLEISFFYNTLARIAVPTFIILSGALLLHKKESYAEFYMKRFKNLILWLIFFNFLYSIFLVNVEGYKKPVTELFLKSFTGEIVYHLWYVYMIIGLYLITPFLREIIQRISETYVKIFIFIGFAIIFLDVNSNFFNIYFDLKRFMVPEILYYLYGAYIVNDAQKIVRIIPAFLLNVFIFFSITYVMFGLNVYATLKTQKFDEYINGYANIYNFIQSVAFINMIILFKKVFVKSTSNLTKTKDILKNIISYIGKHTLNIYFIHIAVLDSLIKFYGNIILKNNYIISIPITSLITFFVSFGISIFIVNVVDVLNKIIYYHQQVLD